MLSYCCTDLTTHPVHWSKNSRKTVSRDIVCVVKRMLTPIKNLQVVVRSSYIKIALERTMRFCPHFFFFLLISNVTFFVATIRWSEQNNLVSTKDSMADIIHMLNVVVFFWLKDQPTMVVLLVLRVVFSCLTCKIVTDLEMMLMMMTVMAISFEM